jgi:hypothetical protein
VSNSVSIVYSRKFTNKLSDGSFEGFELGGTVELDLGEVDSIDDVNGAYDQLYNQFVENVESKVLDIQGSVAPQAAPAAEEPKQQDRLTSWVKKTVEDNTKRIRPAPSEEQRTLPGERFKTPPRPSQAPANASMDEPVEKAAVALENVKVFYDNKQTKIGKTQKGNKFGMLRVGARGQVPGDYVTLKSFEPDVVEDIEYAIENEVSPLNVYGYWEPRNNDPEVFDIVLQGLEQAGR